MSWFFGRKPNPGSVLSTGASGSSATGAEARARGSSNNTTLKYSTVPRFAVKPYNLRRQISVLSGFVAAFEEQNPTDIQLKPNDGQPCIPAHRALLAARSQKFKSIVKSDGCKALPSDADIVSLPELNSDELKSLRDFLYTGSLTWYKLEKHVCSMHVAAVKYEITYLKEYCEQYILASLDRYNVVKMMEFSDAYSNETKEAIIEFIVQNMKDMVSTKEYEEFAFRSPHLAVMITRRLVGPTSKNKKYSRTSSTAPKDSDKPHTTFTGLKIEEHLGKQIDFLCEFVAAFEEQTPTDIQLKPNDGQPSIPTHRAILAARSEVFKSYVESDGCKAPPSDAVTVTLSELNTEELKSLLEFLYTGCLCYYNLQKHIWSMYVAADKYGIPDLQEFCEQHIVQNMKHVVSAREYDDFASCNPHLAMQITRLLVDVKSIRGY